MITNYAECYIIYFLFIYLQKVWKNMIQDKHLAVFKASRNLWFFVTSLIPLTYTSNISASRRICLDKVKITSYISTWGFSVKYPSQIFQSAFTRGGKIVLDSLAAGCGYWSHTCLQRLSRTCRARSLANLEKQNLFPSTTIIRQIQRKQRIKGVNIRTKMILQKIYI